MGCSRLFGSVILSFFLLTSLVANTSQTKGVKLGADTENTVQGEDFDATLYQAKNPDVVIKPGDENHPKNVGLYNKSTAKNPASVSNTQKNPNDVIKAKDASDVIKRGDQSRSDLTPQDKGITNGAEKTKQGEVLRKEGGVLRKEGTVYNKNTQHSTFKINTRIDNMIQTEGRPDCPDGTIADCSGDGDCAPVSWIGDGWCDGEDQPFGYDLTCYDNDGGDCGDSGTTTTTGGGDLLWSAPVSYDWYCTGSYGLGTVNFYADGSADMDGNPGTWFQNTDTYNMPSGLCEGVTITPTVIFVFNNYTTSYAWQTSGNGYPSDPGCGIMDDFGFNGQNVDGTTSLNMADPSMCYDNSSTTTTTSGGGGCLEGTVDDCSGDGDCCPESWIGDGFADCEDQPFGCDLTCYDNDAGDCGGGTTTTTTTTSGGGGCPAGTVDDCSGDGDCCPESWIGDGFEDCEDQAFGCDLTCYDNDAGDCGGGTTTTTTTTTTSGGGGCPAGTVDDCSGDGDCCPESWIADGFEDCEDQAFGCDLTCYDNDGGDCDPADDCEANGQVACHDGACLDTFEDCFALLGDPVRSELISYDWGCTGAPGETIMDVFGVIWNDGSNTQLGFVYGDNLWVHIWNDWSGSEVTIPAGEYCPAWTANSDWGFYFDAAPWVNYGYACEDESNESCEGVHSSDGWYTVGGWSTSLKLNPEECPDGFVDDCVDDDCCPESWIGDGFEDCEDQAFGCDLTCYDNDGGDCDGGTTTTTTTTSGGGECPAGTVQDCVDDDCCPESWIGDGFEDCEDQAFGCDLTCYDNDGGDCGGGTTTTTGGTACDEIVWSTIMTFDWYCTGSYGSASIDFCANGVADLSGNPGTWTSGNETTLVADGLCPLGGEFNNNLSFMFDNYATVYNWDTEGDDIYTPGTGYHDDMGYNGEGNWDGLSCINGGDCSVDTSTTTSGGGECPAGTVDDCSGDGDCCPESWIGDGFEDCEDQAFGCDLTCYDNDGGDCGGGTTTTTTTTTTSGGNCPVGTVPDCSGDGDCCPESWIGDGFEDCEDQAFGCDLTCYNNDGNDCGEGPDPNDDLWNWYDFVTCDDDNQCVGTYEFTLDWNCDEFDIQSAPVTFLYDCTDPNNECNGGTALLFGYEGFWSANPDGGTLGFSDGACEGEVLDWDMFFALPDFGFAAGYDMSGLGTDTITGDGLMDDVFYNGNFNKDGNSSIVRTDTGDTGCAEGTVEDCSGDGDCCPESWIGDGFGDCEDQAFGCDLTCYDNDAGDCGPDCAAGDVNCDGSIDVVDVVNIVNAIINGDVLEGGDVNGDGSLDVVDVVLLVNYIIDGGARAMDADSATMTIADNSLRLSANGYIGGIQMTLTHANGFELNLTDNAMVSEYKTTGTSTTLVVVVPEEELIFTANQSFEVVDMIVANSEVEIDVNTVSEFGITAAYPNPFNPSTTVSLNVPSADFVSVKVYNLVGQVVGVLAEGMMDANTYTFTWNATDMSSGVYMIRAESGSKVDIQKVLLVK